jgi:hypothetical protein
MGDWIGLGFFFLLIVGAIVGLRSLSRTKERTAEEFETNVVNSVTLLGASVNALQGILDPAAAKGKEAVVQMKDGRYQTKRREGKAGGEADPDRAENIDVDAFEHGLNK